MTIIELEKLHTSTRQYSFCSLTPKGCQCVYIRVISGRKLYLVAIGQRADRGDVNPCLSNTRRHSLEKHTGKLMADC